MLKTEKSSWSLLHELLVMQRILKFVQTKREIKIRETEIMKAVCKY